MPYCSRFASIWECAFAIAKDRIDYDQEIGECCPICGKKNCWRAITPYSRLVIDLFPYREERILVARFLCRSTGRTFSLLPAWLVPYHQYTAASMIFALLLAAAGEPEWISSLFAVAEKLLEPDSRVNGFLLGSWLVLCVTGFRRAHAELSRWAGLANIRSVQNRTELLVELASYCRTLMIRGPPHCGVARGLDEVLQKHARTTGRFLFGVPSQERSGRPAP